MKCQEKYTYDTEKLNNISPADMEAAGLLTKSARGERKPNHGYNCVYCSSGTGKNQSGALNFDFKGNHWAHFCHVCGNGGDNLKFFQHVFNADFQDACKQASDMFGVPYTETSSNTTFTPKKRPPLVDDGYKFPPSMFRVPDKTAPGQVPLIKADIADAQKLLDKLPDDQRRGLWLETLQYFGCGFAPQWIHPVTRLGGKTVYNPLPRIIIPSADGEHYNAVALDRDRQLNRGNPDFKPKMHAGAKTQLFNEADIHRFETVIFVEGEIDAMSIWQAVCLCNKPNKPVDPDLQQFGIVATYGTAGWKNLFMSKFDAGLFPWRKVIILFDKDAESEAGQSAAEQFKAALNERNIPAYVAFINDLLLPDEEDRLGDKVDANKYLTTVGNYSLREIITRIVADAEREFGDIHPQTSLDIGSPKKSPVGNAISDAMMIQSAQSAVSTDKPQVEHAANADEIIDNPVDNFNTESITQADDDGDNFFHGEKYMKGLTEDLDNGRRLAKFCGDRVRWLTDSERWLMWSKGVWQRCTNNNSCLAPEVAAFADGMLEYAYSLQVVTKINEQDYLKTTVNSDGTTKTTEQSPACADAKKRLEEARNAEKKAFAIASYFRRVKKVSSAISMMKSVSTILITEKDLDKYHELLNVGNGVIDLSNGNLLPADPKLLFTRQAPAIYHGIDYRDPDGIVEKFLRDIQPDEQTRAALIRFLGYALFGVVKQHVAQLWRGDGRNGKSTALNLTLATLGNDYVAQLPSSAILLTGKPADPNQATTALNPLDGARLAFIDELPQGARLDVQLLKQLTGGGTIAIRHLHQEAKTITARAKIIINTGQYLPRLDNVDDLGLKERLRNVPFNQSFTGDRADPDLMAKLTTPESLSAMLAILVGGAVDWYNSGLIESDEMKRAKQAYLAANDFIREFIEEHCEFGPDYSIARSDMLRRIREKYPAQVTRLFGNSDRKLVEAIAKVDGVDYRRGGKNGARHFYGVSWCHDDDRNDLQGEMLSSADYRPD